MNTKIQPVYTTEQVRQILGLPHAQDVRNLTRTGKALHKALVARGAFSAHRVQWVRKKMVRRRLAEQLGRISPRFLDESHSCACPECQGLAVEWEGRILCENGHTTTEGGEKS